uniref:Uncharacterized protein n=1 Tax=Glossina morsitans morsitans TaxID=37546 RepID=A0A1B0FM71_GLOMM
MGKHRECGNGDEKPISEIKDEKTPQNAENLENQNHQLSQSILCQDGYGGGQGGGGGGDQRRYGGVQGGGGRTGGFCISVLSVQFF